MPKNEKTLALGKYIFGHPSASYINDALFKTSTPSDGYLGKNQHCLLISQIKILNAELNMIGQGGFIPGFKSLC